MKIVLASVMLALGLSGCANYATSTDQQAVHEEGGPLTNPKLLNCKGPGERGRDQFFGENFYYYPARPVTWLFDGSNGADSSAYPVYVKSPAQDGVASTKSIAISMSGEATMNLTRNCDLLQKFHQDYGRKHKAYTEESNSSATSPGWSELLSVKFAPALQNGLNLALQDVTYDQIVASPELREEKQVDVASRTLDSLNRSLGEDYFTEVKVTLFQPTLPESIQRNIEANEAAKQFNEKVATEKATMEELVEILGPYGYLVYKAMQDGNVPVLPVPQGSGVTLPAPTK